MNSFLVSLQAAYSIMVGYRKYPDNTKIISPAIKKVVAFSQGNQYNINPKHIHLTCKFCGGKGYIDTN